MRQLHYAVSRNFFNLRLAIWNALTAYCFVYNKIHYARYGTYYVNQLQRLGHTHPGAREEIESLGLSVRRNNIGIGQAVDLAGEQTYMKSAKTAGKCCTSHTNLEIDISQFSIVESVPRLATHSRPAYSRACYRDPNLFHIFYR